MPASFQVEGYRYMVEAPVQFPHQVLLRHTDIVVEDFICSPARHGMNRPALATPSHELTGACLSFLEPLLAALLVCGPLQFQSCG